MLPSSCDAPSIATVRQRIAAAVDREVQSGKPRPIVVLAIDGIPFDLARRTWVGATHVRLASVFPTTSTSAWLTSLTGVGVDAHGMAGVVVRLAERGEDMVNLAHDRGPIDVPVTDNIFSDAAARGYRPLAIAGDLDAYDSVWRDTLLRHATRIAVGPFCADLTTADNDPMMIAARMETALRAALRRDESTPPALIWCFVDLDYIVHRRGYDEFVCDTLAAIDRVAASLASEDVVVVGHSDHGLVPTRNDPEIERLIAEVTGDGAPAVGGAGRVRWIYAGENAPKLQKVLHARLPATVLVCERDMWFRPGSLAYERIGEILLIATGEAFVAPPGYIYDHGSWLDREIYVPFSHWSGGRST